MNKKRLYVIITFSLIFVLVMTFGKMIYDKSQQKDNDMIEITTISARDITTSVKDKSYTYIDENGVKYLIKEDGMYRINDDGTYTYLNNFVNIPIFQTIEFKNANGYTKEYVFNEDGTYSFTEVFSGFKNVGNGKYKVNNGLDAALNALGKNNGIEGLSEELEIDKDNININNIYVVTIYYGSGVSYDENGKIIEDDVFDYENENEDTTEYNDVVMDEYVIYLEPYGKATKTDNGFEYSITGRAIDPLNNMYYIDSNSSEEHNHLTIKTKYKVYKASDKGD